MPPPFSSSSCSLAFITTTTEEASRVNRMAISHWAMLRHPLQGPVNVTAPSIASYPVPGVGKGPGIDQPVIRQALWSSGQKSSMKWLLAWPEKESAFLLPCHSGKKLSKGGEKRATEEDHWSLCHLLLAFHWQATVLQADLKPPCHHIIHRCIGSEMAFDPRT